MDDEIKPIRFKLDDESDEEDETPQEEPPILSTAT